VAEFRVVGITEYMKAVAKTRTSGTKCQIGVRNIAVSENMDTESE
jgi:hypothetical protein